MRRVKSYVNLGAKLDITVNTKKLLILAQISIFLRCSIFGVRHLNKNAVRNGFMSKNQAEATLQKSTERLFSAERGTTNKK